MRISRTPSATYSMFLFRDSAASLFQSLQTQYYRITLAFQTLLFNNGIQFIADLWSDPNMSTFSVISIAFYFHTVFSFFSY